MTAVQDVPIIEETARLFVRNLPYSTTEADLAEAFREHGEVSEAHLVLDRWPQALTTAACTSPSAPCMSLAKEYQCWKPGQTMCLQWASFGNVRVDIAEMKAGRACRTTKKSKGIALIQFAEADGALAAKEALDGAIFQGRLLHVLPAHRPPPPKQAPEQASLGALPARHTPGCVPHRALRQRGRREHLCAQAPE